VKKVSILSVDDDRAILQTLKAILESRGYVTDTAETGGEAIEKSKSKFFSLALLDIRLPDMEGHLSKNGEDHDHRISLTRKRL